MNEHAADLDFPELARAASAGDKQAAGKILAAVQDGVYELALRMLGHPADAEDAAQEILAIVLTHLGSFRGESAFTTWVWRIAANHLARARRGRRETITLPLLDERLRSGLREEPTARSDPESEALTRELHFRCTEGMLLGLDRELRIAYVLGAIMGLSGEEAAEVLQLDQAAYRKRLSRARQRLFEFLRDWCGVFSPRNACRCGGQVDSAIERGLLAPGDLYLSRQRRRPHASSVARATDELLELVRVAEVLRGPASYLAPDTLANGVRGLLDTSRSELLAGD